MEIQKSHLLAFNRGIVSSLGLARIDIERVGLSAETQTNWMPRVLGSMALRPGLEYITSTYNDSAARLLPFVFSTTDTALIELSASNLRVLINDVVITRPSVSSAVTNGDFDTLYNTTFTVTIASPGVFTYVGADNFADDDPVYLTTTGALPTGLAVDTVYYIRNVITGANTFELATTQGASSSIATSGTQSGVHTVHADYYLTGWTDNDEAGAISEWVTGDYMQLTGTGTAAAIQEQLVSVAAGDQGTEHALMIVIKRGPVELSIGSTSGGEDYVTRTMIDEGTHSLAFTPTGDFYIQFLSRLERLVQVESCNIEASGDMVIPTTYAAGDLDKIRHAQSGDIIFVACKDQQQRKIERRGARSWSFVKYWSDDGPFRLENLTPTTIASSGLTGNVTLTSSTNTFRSDDVGELFSITSVGQEVTATISAENVFTDAIRVVGVGANRAFLVVISGRTDSTITLQQSIESDAGPWTDYASYTLDTSGTSVNDTLDNQIIYYRIGIATGDYGTDTVQVDLDFPSGSIVGAARITGYTSPTSASAEVLKDLGGTAATDIWAEGAWSDYTGWPTSVVFHEGRLWWSGINGIWGSVSDSYYSFDPDVIGDSGAINRSIGTGPVDTVNWMASMDSMVLGTNGAEFMGRSSVLGEILTPTSFTLKDITNQGSGDVEAIKIDQSVLFVNRSGIKVYEISFDASNYSFSATDITALIPELGKPGISRMQSHRQPDTRIHVVKSDGKVMLALSDKNEDVLAWVEVVSDGASGEIEDVVTLPATTGNADDDVYYVVKRVINGSTVRYIEKMAQEDECRGGTLNKQADSFLIYSGAATASITGLSHLEGESVVVWADGEDVGTDDSSRPWTQIYTVSGGAITLAVPASNVVVGLPYTAPYKSTKLGRSTGSPLNKIKRINHMGIIAENIHKKGLKFGPDTSNLDDMPGQEGGTDVTNEVHATYDEIMIEFDGKYTTDSRICLEAVAPRPVTLLALTYDLEM